MFIDGRTTTSIILSACMCIQYACMHIINAGITQQIQASQPGKARVVCIQSFWNALRMRKVFDVALYLCVCVCVLVYIILVVYVGTVCSSGMTFIYVLHGRMTTTTTNVQRGDLISINFPALRNRNLLARTRVGASYVWCGDTQCTEHQHNTYTHKQDERTNMQGQKLNNINRRTTFHTSDKRKTFPFLFADGTFIASMQFFCFTPKHTHVKTSNT